MVTRQRHYIIQRKDLKNPEWQDNSFGDTDKKVMLTHLKERSREVKSTPHIGDLRNASFRLVSRTTVITDRVIA